MSQPNSSVPSVTESWRLRFGRWSWILVWPRCWAYGDFLLGICVPLAIARAEGKGVIFVRAGHYRSDSVFDVVAAGVPILVLNRPFSLLATALLKLRAWLLLVKTATGDWVLDAVFILRTYVQRRRIVRAGGKVTLTRKLWRGRRKESRRSIAELPYRRQVWYGRDQRFYGCDVRRILANSWSGTALRYDAEARRRAEMFGLEPQTPLVTVHVREAGWHDVVTGHQLKEYDSKRDARIADFFPCFDFLRDRGFTVVRIGDSTMTPVTRPGVVDLTGAEASDNLLQLWAVKHSQFMIACDSGPFALAWLFHVPMLMVNVACHLDCYPLRHFDRMMFKRVTRTNGQLYSLRDMWKYEFLAHYKRLDKSYYQDNTSEELRAAAEEMCDVVATNKPLAPSEGQRALRRLADDLNHAPEVIAKMNRRNDPGYLYTGDGYVSDVLAASCSSINEYAHVNNK